jgi:hypothetical protein
MPTPATSAPRRLGRRAALVAVLALVVAVPLLAACEIAGPSTATGTQDLEVAVPAGAPAVQVGVEMFNGPVDVRAGAPGTVSATVTTTGVGSSPADAEADRAKIQVTLDANPDGTIRLRAVYQPNPSSPNNRSASAVVEVPPGAALTISTSNGRADSTGVAGPVDVSTSNGPVRVAEATAGARVRTSNKEVEVDGSGTFEISTSNAAIILRGEGATVRADTSNATISFEGSMSDAAQSLQTSNESIYVLLPAGASFGIDAQTSGGAPVIVEGFEVRTTGAASRSTLQGTVGTGGPSITLRTSNKSIEVRALNAAE